MKKSLAIISLMIFSGSCSPSKERMEEMEKKAEALLNVGIPVGDSIPIFSKTAQLRFQASSVEKSTLHVERLVRQMGGYVANSSFQSETGETKQVPTGGDSAVKISVYHPAANILCKIPELRLDSFLLALSNEIQFLDQRQVSCTDISGALLADELKQMRNIQVATELKNLQHEHDLKDKTKLETIEKKAVLQEGTDEAWLSQRTLKDKDRYSEVSLQLYENPVTRTDISEFQAAITR